MALTLGVMSDEFSVLSVEVELTQHHDSKFSIHDASRITIHGSRLDRPPPSSCSGPSQARAAWSPGPPPLHHEAPRLAFPRRTALVPADRGLRSGPNLQRLFF